MRTFAFLLLLTSRIAAAPFLVCDPVPANTGNQGLNVVSYVITGLATTNINVQATINADGSQQLHYDVGALANGNYTITVAAVNGYAQESAFTAPFAFTIGAPATPMGLRLSPT